MVEAVAIKDRSKIATMRVKYIVVMIGQPSDPVPIGRVDVVAQSERDPVSARVKEILHIHGDRTVSDILMQRRTGRAKG